MQSSVPSVLHILPVDLARGAQTYAKALREALDGQGQRHRTLTLFGADVIALSADTRLGVPAGRLRRFGIDPRAVFALRRHVTQESPDLVVAHGSEPLKYAVLALPRNVPLAYYKIGVATANVSRPVRRWLHQHLLRRCQFVAGVSQECLDEAHHLLGAPRDRMVLIPNGRDPRRYHPTTAVTSRERPRLIFVGHLSPSKRPDRFFDVVRALRGRGMPLDAIVVGDGPMLDGLRARGSTEGVEVMGRREDVPALLAGSDIFVFTSIVEGEGMPGVFIEAGLCAVPVVATRVPGATTVIQEGVTGFVVDVDDFAGMVDRVSQLVADPGLRANMGAAALRRCLAGFTVEASVGRWHRAIAELLEDYGWPRTARRQGDPRHRVAPGAQ